MEPILRQFKTQLETWPEWQTAQKIVLAVSGGVDSMVLMRLMLELCHLQEYKDRHLVIAHFNHCLRSKEIHDFERDMVIKSAKEMNLTYFVSKWENPSESNIEANARYARYRFLADVVDATQADCLMTAHHLDDAVETVFMRLIRGASIRGLMGMPSHYQRLLETSKGKHVSVSILRPLIGFRKEQLYDYAHKNNLAYNEDDSNHQPNHLRNRIRNDYLPLFESENPQFFQNLVSMQKQLQLAYQALYSMYIRKEPLLVGVIKEGVWVLDVKAWCDLEAEIRRTFLTIFFEERFLPEVGQYDKDIIQGIEDQMLNAVNPNHTLNLSKGWIARREYDFIYIESQLMRPIVKDKKVELNQPDKWYSLDNGLWIGLFNANYVNNQMRQSVDQYVTLDLSSLDHPIHFSVRHRQAGDVMELASKEGLYHKKVSRIMIDEKVPPALREQMWLVVNDQEAVIWLIGQQISATYQPKNPQNVTHYLLLQKMY